MSTVRAFKLIYTKLKQNRYLPPDLLCHMVTCMEFSRQCSVCTNWMWDFVDLPMF